MNFRLLAYTCLALGAFPQAGRAADVINHHEPAPAFMPSWSWGGGYVGGQLGYGWGSSRVDSEIYDGYAYGTGPDDGWRDSTRMKPKGFLGGVYAGYNFDTGSNVILGLEGDIVGAGMKDSFTDRDEDTGDLLWAERKLQWAGAVRARAGYAMDRFLPYIAGGVAFGSVKSKVHIEDDFSRQIGQSDFEASRTFVGWTLGAGIDYAATDNIVLRLEYRYTDYGKKSDDFGFFRATDSLKSNDIRLGVAYKF